MTLVVLVVNESARYRSMIDLEAVVVRTVV